MHVVETRADHVNVKPPRQSRPSIRAHLTAEANERKRKAPASAVNRPVWARLVGGVQGKVPETHTGGQKKTSTGAWMRHTHT